MTATKTSPISPDDLAQAIILSGRKRASAEKTARTIRQFLSWESKQRVNAPLDKVFAMWLNAARAEGLSPALVRSRLYAGKAWLTHSEQNTGVLDTYKLPPLADPVPHPLPTGIKGVRAMLDHSIGPSRWLIALQGLAGLRVSEARTLRRENIDAARQQLVVKGKGDKVRRVPISRELAEILKEMPKQGVLVGLSDSGARLAVTRTAKRAGVSGADGGTVSSHDLRATFATAIFQKTRDVLLVSRLLGHSSVVVTQRYLATGQDELTEAVEL